MSKARAGRSPQGRVGTVINGKWQVDARIGSGGMATVYAATHRNGHRAALKMLHTQLSREPQVRARFLREGYVANAVGHPGVVSVLDDGVTEDGAVFLVLELLEGETIDARRIRLGGALPIDEVLELAEDALDVLAAAHGKGIVHRDVKPENVFLTNDGQIKLLDFGLARMKDARTEATATGITIGTPEFMPPEQAAGRRDVVDARSDVWGLGATLFTAITGRYVHDDAQSLQEQLIASATRRSRPIRQLAPHVSPAIAQVIDRALELEMGDRWPSARDMQAAFRAARGPRETGFTADSMTVPVTSTRPSSPLALDIGAQLAKTQAAPMVASQLAAHGAPASDPAHRVQGQAPPPPSPAPMATQRMRGSLPSWHPPDEHGPRSSAPPASFRVSQPPPSFGRPSTPHVPPGLMPAPSAPQRSSTRAIVLIALLLTAVVAAMGAYVLSRGAP
ncbi:MAG: Protein kinase [Labilithrix sp.]|nr:Protein kinase [Labilithrix sp.]